MRDSLLLKAIKKSIRVFRDWVYFPFRHLLPFLIEILKMDVNTFIKKLQNISNENDCFIRIDPIFTSTTLIRDLLIGLNRMAVQVSSLGNKIDTITVCLDRYVRFNNWSEVYPCFLLNPQIVDTHFCWFNSIPKEQRESSGLQVFVNDQEVPIQATDYFNTCEKNYLDVPLSTKVWARSILKGYKPGAFIVGIHYPEFSEESWRFFFTNAWEDFPHIHFLLLDFSIDWNKEWATHLSNVTITKILGYNFLEEFALVRLSDMFIGSYDKYAIAVIGTSRPFLLFGSSEINRSPDPQINCSTQQLSQELSQGKHQTWILDIPSPIDFYTKFKQFYLDVDHD